MSVENLAKMYALADATDLAEGRLAYVRYNSVMRSIAERYNFDLEKAVAVFCSTSPNNDYINNLRSTISILDGINRKIPEDRIVISTYNHCRKRAYSYATGAADFLGRTMGPKIFNFYHNILSPDDSRFVTIDGHMCAAWRGKKLTMKEALVRGRREYLEIANGCKLLATVAGILPNQFQAVVWFARKRTLKIKYNGQLDLLKDASDKWETLQDIDKLKPYSRA